MNTTNSRTKKVYHLRKTVTSAIRNKDTNNNINGKGQDEKQQREEISQFIRQQSDDNSPTNNNNSNVIGQNNNSFLKRGNNNSKENNNILQENGMLEEQPISPGVDGPQLSINTLFLSFEQKLDCIQTKSLKLKNIGSSAIYYQWKFKNEAKINVNAIKDLKPKFFCHYSKQSIKPGEEITFIFSFVSEIPGFFAQQCELICEPALITPIPVIRLQGRAYIDDQWKEERASFLKELEASMRECSVKETLDDVIDEVRLPEPQRPNVKDLKVAEQIFEKVNENLQLYFNPYIHKWFNELYEEVWTKENPDQNASQLAYWDQSIQSFKGFINECNNIDYVQKKCFLQRLEHYTHLSTFPLPNKSELYQTVYQIVSDAAYHLGGDYADSSKKELDMWEVPFKQPLDTDAQEEFKARKEEIDKIKAEWLKRTKKKKWTQEEEKLMVEDFKNRVRSKTTNQILTKFDGFESQAEYIKMQKAIESDNFNPEKYFLFLKRMKTVNQYSLEGKKVFLKFNLKLKDNCEKQLRQLNQYLVKKEQEKKKLEEQKKNTDAKKKKPVPKKKGQKDEEEQKPLTFDFSSILDQQNWNGFLQTFRMVQERSPYLILIGCTYRQRLGRADTSMTVGFLLEHLKTIEPSIQFMSHSQLSNIRQNLENENISQGSIFFVENLNFLPSQTLSCEEIEVYQEGGVQKHKKTKRNVLYPEVRQDLNLWASAFDVIVDEDRFLSKWSGISSYSHVEVVLGKTWWNYVASAQRSQNQSFILSGDFSPESYFLIKRLLKYCKLIYLTGTLGVKFKMASRSIKQIGNVKINDKQTALMKEIVSIDHQRLVIPDQFKFLSISQEGQQRKCVVLNLSDEDQEVNIQEVSGHDFIDIASPFGQIIAQRSSSGYIYMIGKSHTIQYNHLLYGHNSTTQILRSVYKLQQQKRARHSIEVNTPSGIDFNQDIVFYLVGVEESDVQAIELKEKKVRIMNDLHEDEDQQAMEQADQQEEEGENEKKKIDLVADFKLSSAKTMINLLSGKFDHGLKNVSKYPKPRVI